MGRRLILTGTKLTDTTAPVLVSLLASDDFARADGPAGTTPVGARTWTATKGNPWTISSGALIPPAALGTDAGTGARFGINVGQANMEVTATLAGAAYGHGVIARMSADGSGYVLYHNSSLVQLVAVGTSGTGTKIGEWAVGQPALPFTLTLRIVGSTLTAYRNGALVGTVTDTTHAAGTFAGLRAQATSGITADNFRVTTAA